MIGKPLHAEDYADATRSEKENIERFTAAMRERIIELERMSNDRNDPKK